MSFDEVAIRVRNVSKHYMLFDHPEDRLKQSLVPRLQRLLGRPPKQYFRDFAALNDAIDDLAKTYGVTPTGIAVAWITRHPAKIQVVLGTTKPERVTESAAGSDVQLTREEWYRLFTAAGHILP